MATIVLVFMVYLFLNNLWEKSFLQFVNLFLEVDDVECELLDFLKEQGVHLADVDTLVQDLAGGGDVLKVPVGHLPTRRTKEAAADGGAASHRHVVTGSQTHSTHAATRCDVASDADASRESCITADEITVVRARLLAYLMSCSAVDMEVAVRV